MFKIGSRFNFSDFVPSFGSAPAPNVGDLVAAFFFDEGASEPLWEIVRVVRSLDNGAIGACSVAANAVRYTGAWAPLTAKGSRLIPEVGEVIRVSPDDSTLENAVERKFIRISEDGAGVVCENAIQVGEFTWEYWERIPTAGYDAADEDSVAFTNALTSGNIDELVNFLKQAFATEENIESIERKLESAFSKEDVALLNAVEAELIHALFSGSDDVDGEDDLTTFEGAVSALNREGCIDHIVFSDNSNTYSRSRENWNEDSIAAVKSALETKRARDAALSKLTPAERTLLGLDN